MGWGLSAQVAEEAFQRVRGGDVGGLSRALTLLESGDATALTLSRLAWEHRRSGTLGFTGPPGAGKSTLIGAVVRALRQRGATVGVLAIDPSSPLSGGSVLGDRFRMREHNLDDGVFIRSMASRNAAGGLAGAAADAVALLSVAYDWVLVESVGVGQGEVDINGTVDSTVVVLNPGAGDVVQSLKAGLLEVADLYVINKADRDGAHSLQADLESLIHHAPRRDGWQPTVLRTVATDRTGVDDLLEVADARRAYIGEPSTWERHADGQLTTVSRTRALEVVRQWLDGYQSSDDWRSAKTALLSPRDGARHMVNALAAAVAQSLGSDVRDTQA
ncbi:methylmalonyl Co-A mutase-associated GTPase MeaB [Pseudofrankia sp. BMG5.37]|uniref:methylmalonyl Co-A mutase-associated GTPase MeaB n=1 Tax=Pseudofrankia sp. BMG5.37 TaxID=3050035 RepID=UPI0023788100|nr:MULTISPECIES: methylmalonyl Co-A mutase-associated GTPase MeaB [unclassified Pseudofrankia]MDT3446567.1 methylmalonyl Co-A mutase-associated GTPase MeaB [Pseudofrankia sp. BMG5.37]